MKGSTNLNYTQLFLLYDIEKKMTIGKAMAISLTFCFYNCCCKSSQVIFQVWGARKEASGLFQKAINLSGNKTQRDRVYWAYLEPLKIQWSYYTLQAFGACSLQEGRKHELVTVTRTPQCV